MIGKSMTCWKILFTSFLLGVLFSLSPSQTFAIDKAAVEKALTGNKTANFMNIRFKNPKVEEKVIVIMSNLDSPSVNMMMLFEDDQCKGVLRHRGGNGSFSLNCENGSKLKSNFSCQNSSQCFIRGKHSQRGKFVLNFRHKNKTMDIDEILEFATPAYEVR